MTEADWIVLERYVRQLADLLGLRDWTFLVGRDPCPAENAAAVGCTYGRRLATVQVCADFREIHEDRQRIYLVHELLHCHLDAMGEVLSDLEAMVRLNPSEMAAIRSGHRRAEELGVDGIATAIAPLLPAIEWGR